MPPGAGQICMIGKIKMKLINELRDFTKDVPEKKIILDQLNPLETALLVLKIAAYSAIDSQRGKTEYHSTSEEDVDMFIESVVEQLNRLTTKSNMLKALKDAKAGKI